MGYALAEAAVARGADVTVVTGPVSLPAVESARTIRVRSASEMYDAVLGNLDSATVVIMAAAVADYRPVRVAGQKIKKGGGLAIELERTDDILASVGRIKESKVVIGFAAETENIVANARKKLLDKGADLIVANDVSAEDSGFDVETNRVTLVLPEVEIDLPLLTKREAADRIIDAAMKIKSARSGG
jgi:phosphopantothenoylcysteine decarboxylase/phosphopantothenate--cysteine ligase